MFRHRSCAWIARRILLAFFLLVTYQSSHITATGQSATATLSGTVVDENGAVISGATVIALNTATAIERQVKTSGDGYFILPLLPPGTYTIKAERDGFATLEIRGVVLNVNDQRDLKIQLKVATVGATVTVVDSPSSVKTDAAVSSVVDRQFVENLPLNGRSFQSLISLTPGVVLTPSINNSRGQFSPVPYEYRLKTGKLFEN